MELLLAAILGVGALGLVDDQLIISVGLGLAALAMIILAYGVPSSEVVPILVALEILVAVSAVVDAVRHSTPAIRP